MQVRNGMPFTSFGQDAHHIRDTDIAYIAGSVNQILCATVIYLFYFQLFEPILNSTSDSVGKSSHVDSAAPVICLFNLNVCFVHM